MQQLDLKFYPIVKNVLGEERQVDKVWPDGSYNCPFCGSAAPPQGCQNPACSAGEYALSHPEQTRAIYEQRKREADARKEEERWRKERDEFSKNYAEEQRQERARQQGAIEAECAKKGACVRCALEGFPYRKPKFVKHRGQCPKK